MATLKDILKVNADQARTIAVLTDKLISLSSSIDNFASNNNNKEVVLKLNRLLDEYKKDSLSKSAEIIGLTSDVHRLTIEMARYSDKIEAQNKETMVQNDQLSNLMQQLEKANDTIAKLVVENEKLKRQKDRNSSNSSKPPSSDGFNKRYSDRTKSDKSVGGQPGHKGNTLELRKPDEIELIQHQSNSCSCGGSIIIDSETFTTKQVVDIEIITKTKEYHFYHSKCDSCGAQYSPSFDCLPNKSRVQYGNNLRSLIAMIREVGTVSINRICQMMDEITDGAVRISAGQIVNITKELAKKSQPLMDSMKEKIINSAVLNVDETTTRECGEQHWVQTYSTEECTYLQSNKKRGKKGTQETGILEIYKGILVSDHFSSYLKHERRGECGAHLLRYLQAAKENYNREWSKEMTELLLQTNNAKKLMVEQNQKEFSQEYLELLMQTYDAIIRAAKEEFQKDANPHKDYNGEDMKLMRRMEKFKEETIHFAKNFEVPFTNNLAERDLRGLKTKLKMSGSFRSPEGTKSHLVNRSVLQTSRKLKVNPCEIIKKIFDDEILEAKNLLKLA